MRAAIVVDGVVTNVLTLASIDAYGGPGIAIAIPDDSPVGRGDAHAEGTFMRVEPVSVPQVITPSAFLSLFTAQELNAAAAHPALAGWWRIYEGLREGVERDSARTLEALDALLALEIITPARAAAIRDQWPRT